jgi:serine/threonine-protein kinase HipA
MSVVDVSYEGADGPWTVARAAQQGTETFVEYTAEHQARGIELAPLSHPNADRARRFAGLDAAHLPGLLADALPDSWGQLLLRRDMGRHGIENPGPLQMLTWLGRRTMGALVFHPVDGPDVSGARLVDLDQIQDEMLRHLAGEAAADPAANAVTVAAGSGAGGARPKITAAYTPSGDLVADSGGELPPGSAPWLVKFHGRDDSAHLSSIEATYLEMAAATGITVCDHQLLTAASGARYLAVRRFDRVAVPGRQPDRVHMSSAAGLLEQYPEYHQHPSYADVIRLTRAVTSDVRDVTEMLRRAVFNVVAHNRDDHARNTAYLWAPSTGWRLAPAFDLTHSMGPRPAYLADAPGEHYLDVAGKGKDITRDDLRSLSAAAGVKPADVDQMIDAALAAVAQWPALAAANGVPSATVDAVAARLPALRH